MDIGTVVYVFYVNFVLVVVVLFCLFVFVFSSYTSGCTYEISYRLCVES